MFRMSGKTSRSLLLFLLGVLVPMVSSVAKTTCALDTSEQIVSRILEVGDHVDVHGNRVPIPPSFQDLGFKVVDGRGQFVFHLSPEDRSEGAEADSDSVDSLPALHSIMFTNNVAVTRGWEVFGVRRSCSLGDVGVSFLGMRQDDGKVLESTTVLLSFENGASVLLFGRAFDNYLEAFRRLNHMTKVDE